MVFDVEDDLEESEVQSTENEESSDKETMMPSPTQGPKLRELYGRQ